MSRDAVGFVAGFGTLWERAEGTSHTSSTLRVLPFGSSLSLSPLPPSCAPLLPPWPLLCPEFLLRHAPPPLPRARQTLRASRFIYNYIYAHTSHPGNSFLLDPCAPPLRIIAFMRTRGRGAFRFSAFAAHFTARVLSLRNLQSSNKIRGFYRVERCRLDIRINPLIAKSLERNSKKGNARAARKGKQT